ncbi:MAG TPA: peptidoglycan-binding domain-containing protein [Gammaproteobacteria bacterium]|nr:peptidoglycan-binding domain-containing protein [Gammaproteobacteria bacterium]
MKDHKRLFGGRLGSVPSSSLRRSVIAALLVPLSTVPLAVHAAPDDVVLLWGTTTEGPEMVSAFSQFEGGLINERMTAERACQKVQQFVFWNVAGPVSDALNALGVGQPTGDFDIPGCPHGDEISRNTWLIYTSCAMIMGNGTQYLRWTVPPLTSEPEMVAIDFSTGEGVRVPLETRLQQLEDALQPMEDASQGAIVPMGELTQFSISGSQATERKTLNVSEDGRGFNAREFTSHSYEYSYTAKIGTVAGFDFMANLGTIKSEGQAWIVPDAPGADVFSLFYDNFRNYVSPSAGTNSLMAGALLQMAGIASRGIPVQTTHKSSMSMGAMSVLSSGVAGADATSTASIDRIMVLPGKAAGVCGPARIPEGVEITDLDEAMAAAQGAGAGAGPNSPEFQEAMRQASEAMEQMTPEQRQMMEQLGMGGMMPGAPAASSAGAAPGGGSSRGAAPGGGSSGDAMPSRAELHSDDMAQMVQKHLQALGYDPGNADGDVTTDTIIAISEFQADQGLKVTGEVSPQLAGVLSAEVDKRR